MITLGRASLVSLVVKNPPAEGNGNPLQYSCLENPLDRGAWQATQSRGLQSQTRLSS